MESAWETAKEGGGIAASVCNVLLVVGPSSINFWGRDLDLVGGNVLGSGGVARGIPKANNGIEVRVVEGRYMEKCGSIYFP